MKLKKDFSTHTPVLIDVLQNSSGTVIELGSGIFSTPLLHWLCFKDNRKVITYENDVEYYDFSIQFKSDNHEVVFVDSWSSIIFDDFYGVAFIDHDPTNRRITDMLLLMDKTDFIVLHDSERSKFQEILSCFKYRYDFTLCSPNTSIVSEFKDYAKIINTNTGKKRNVSC